MRRVILLLAVMSVMAAIMVASALPALAAPPIYRCIDFTMDPPRVSTTSDPTEARALEDLGFRCERIIVPGPPQP